MDVLLAVMLNNLYLVTSIYFFTSATRLIATCHTIRVSTAAFPRCSQGGCALLPMLLRRASVTRLELECSTNLVIQRCSKHLLPLLVRRSNKKNRIRH